jgi:hypothetical protein
MVLHSNRAAATPEAPAKRAGRPPKSLQELMDANPNPPTALGAGVALGPIPAQQALNQAGPQPDYEQVRLAVLTHAENKGHAATMDILRKQFGVDSAKKLKPEQYAAALKACQDGLGVA